MDTISVEDMKIVDENTSYLGIPTILLMENAGNGVSKIIQSQLKSEKNKIIIFAGTGNNGGDGFVIARHLAAKITNNVSVILIGTPDKIRTHDAQVNWNAIMGLDSIKKYLIRDSTDFIKYNSEFQNPDIVVDALLGTGISGTLREPIASTIRYMNKLNGLKVSIDVPSGMNPETGEITDICINADITITFHKAKPGLIKSNSKCGELKVIPIGIPLEAEYIVGTGDLRYVAKKRDSSTHKGDYGRILVIGGSDQYSGAPAIAGLAALRTGSDLVIITAPKEIAGPLRSYSPNLIIKGYQSDYLTPGVISEFENLFTWADAIIIGPGLGTKTETFNAVKEIMQKLKALNKPTLIDADAIKALAENKDLITSMPVVITPHKGEFNIFTNNTIELPENLMERAKKINEVAQLNKITILLKGAIDIIANGNRFKLNKTGTPAMTIGGTGDCLSGIVGSLLGRGFNTFRSAAAGAFICGKAGELAEKNANGPHIMATDLLNYISFQKILNL
ncbi:MAG: NAD(P)H-hydrate dehydratase [Candidatus Helarchaeota archaeon]